MQNEPRDVKTDADDPRQAMEEGEPQLTGRGRGPVLDGQDEQAPDRNNPDTSPESGRKDASATTPHRESGDRA